MVNNNIDKSDGKDRTTETTSIGISWVQYAHRRKEFKLRWPCIWNLKVITTPFDDVQCLVLPESILDVGATDKVWKSTVESLWPEILYHSLDIDRTNIHDYYDFNDVDRKFDLVMCFEVLEHITSSELLQMIRDCIKVTKEEGYLIFSVPNLLSDSYWMDFTHKTALSFWDLPTLMSYCGLDIIKGARWFNGSTRKRLIHQYLCYPMHRVMNKDFCQSVIMIGQKTTE